MQAHIRQTRADQLRAHYARVYNARPSPEILRVSAAARSPSRSPNSRRKARRPTSSSGSTRPPSSGTFASNVGRLGKSRSSVEIHKTAFSGNSRTKNVRDRQNSTFQHSRQGRQRQLLAPPSDDFWTERYLHDYDRQWGSAYDWRHATSEDEVFHHPDNLRPGWDSLQMGSSGRMRAPKSVYASTGDISSAGLSRDSALTRVGSMSEKIDQFLTVVQRCEQELKEEFEERRRRIQEKKMLRSPFTAPKRSVSSVSNHSGGGGGGNPSRQPRSSSSHVSARSFNVSDMESNGSSKKRKKRRPASSSAATALSAYVRQTPPPRVVTERWAAAATPTATLKKSVRRQPTPTSSLRSSMASNYPGSRARGQPRKQATPPPPSVNIDHVQSALRASRNYQPPRRRRLIKKKSRKALNRQQQDFDYEEDFEKEEEERSNNNVEENDDADEEDEEEEEEEDEAGNLLTRQWINDQAVRGMVRQKAMMASSSGTARIHDKESSKDSAYGYSGGESRLATREPTPDTQQQQQQNGNRYGSVGRRRQQQARLSGRGDSLRTSFNGTSKELDSEDEKSSAYIHFVTRVTADILRKGIFTEKAIREALDNNLKRHDNSSNSISKKELAVLAAKLRKEFGISSGGVNNRSNGNSLSGSMGETDLKDLLRRPGRGRAKQNRPRVEVSVVRGEQEVVSGEDEELTNILYEVDLDESVVQEVLRSVQREKNTGKMAQSQVYGKEDLDAAAVSASGGQLKIFDAMNISNLNISFNAQQQPREKRSQQRELLIKSFAQQQQQQPVTRPKSAVVNRPGSSKTVKRNVAKRQDSSSSNNADNAAEKASPVKKQQQSRNPPPSARKKSLAEKSPPRNRLPDTPLHSSETPRSSSLYHPEESDEEVDHVDDKNDDDHNKGTADEVNDSEISDDDDEAQTNGGDVYASDDFEEDVDEEIDEDDQE